MSTPPAEPARSNNKKLIGCLIAAIVMMSAAVLYRYTLRPPEYKPKYQTIAHKYLDLESTYYPVSDDAYRLLDDVIDDVKARVQYDPKVTDPTAKEQQFLDIFHAIDAVMIERNFIFPPGVPTATPFEALDGKYLTSSELQAATEHSHNGRRILHMQANADGEFHLCACGPSAFICMGIAESMGFELKAVLLPQHIFVRAMIDSDHWVNWDENRGRSISDDGYITNWGVEPYQISEHVYMEPLSADKVQSEIYTSIGVHLGNKGTPSSRAASIECYRKALSLNPRSVYAQNNLALNLLYQSDPDAATCNEALELTQNAITYQPHLAPFQATRAYALAAVGRTAEATAAMQKAVELDPKDAYIAEMQPMIQDGYRLYDAARSLHPFSFWFYLTWPLAPILLAMVFFVGLVFVIHRLAKRRRRQPQPPPLPTFAFSGQPMV